MLSINQKLDRELIVGCFMITVSLLFSWSCTSWLTESFLPVLQQEDVALFLVWFVFLYFVGSNLVGTLHVSLVVVLLLTRKVFLFDNLFFVFYSC